MEILGIGPLELLFIVIIALLLLGPKDMIKTGRTIGTFLRKVVTSEGWFEFRKSLREIRNLPYSMMREAGMEDMVEAGREISRATKLDGPAPDFLPKGKTEATSLGSWIQPVEAQAPAKHNDQNPETLPASSDNPPADSAAHGAETNRIDPREAQR